MARHFSIGRIVTFLTGNLVGGLLQVWILYAALFYLHKNHDASVILGDGGLFFFAASLTINSFLVWISDLRRKPTASEVNATLFALGGSIGVGTAVYTAVFTNRIGIADPFGNCVSCQVACALVAMAYAFFIGTRTGYFSAR